MGVYYPQASMTLHIIWEDFNLKSDASLQKIYELPIQARNVNVHINDYRQADTFDAEIDFKQFPFDPRAIRACGVRIAMQDMERLFQADGKSLSVIKPSEKNTIFMGFADQESISFDEEKRTVKLEGRDFTALLIDRKFLGKPINLALPVDVIITQLLAELKEVAQIKVVNRVPAELPAVGKFSAHMAKAPKLGTMRSAGKEESYWDVIQDIVARSALIAYIELDKLIITKPRALYSDDQTVKFVYGKNLKDLNYQRKLGRKKNFNVLVRSLPKDGKEALNAEIPLNATDEWARSTGITNGKRIKIPIPLPTPATTTATGSDANAALAAPLEKDAPIIAFLVPDIADQKHLIEIGEQIYEEMSRQEIEGSFTTMDLTAHFFESEQFNLFQLRNATPLQITIDQGDLKGVAAKKTAAEKERFLVSNGYPPSVAHALADTLSNKRINSPFYTKSVRFSITADSGVVIKVDFINFINLPKNLGGNQ